MLEADNLSQKQRMLLEQYLREDLPLEKSKRSQEAPFRSSTLAHNGGPENGNRSGVCGYDEPSPAETNGRAHRVRKGWLPRRAFNRLLHLIARFGPGGAALRPFLHRMRGVRIGKGVWIGDDVYLDNDFPHCIEVQDGAMIELRTTIIAHTHGEGRVVIGKNAFVGAGSMIVTAANRTVVIGEGCVIMASSMVNRSVPPFTLYGSDCAKPLAKIKKPFTGTTSYDEFIHSIEPFKL